MSLKQQQIKKYVRVGSGKQTVRVIVVNLLVLLFK